MNCKAEEDNACSFECLWGWVTKQQDSLPLDGLLVVGVERWEDSLNPQMADVAVQGRAERKGATELYAGLNQCRLGHVVLPMPGRSLDCEQARAAEEPPLSIEAAEQRGEQSLRLYGY